MRNSTILTLYIIPNRKLRTISIQMAYNVAVYTADTLTLRGIKIGRHFYVNMKVQTATCKDKNNSKSRAATFVKFEVNISDNK